MFTKGSATLRLYQRDTGVGARNLRASDARDLGGYALRSAVNLALKTNR